MTTQHTKGRLRYEHGLLLSNNSPDEMAQIPFYRDGIHDHDARRLVACWNACLEIPTELLENLADDEATIAPIYRDLIVQRDELMRTNAELLTALKGVLAWGTDENWENARAWCEKARAAIAKAEGDAA